MATDREATAREYAARENKSARWAAYFIRYEVPVSVVAGMAWRDPRWNQLAKAISQESGRKLLPPHSQETVDCIVRNLRWYEEAK